MYLCIINLLQYISLTSAASAGLDSFTSYFTVVRLAYTYLIFYIHACKSAMACYFLTSHSYTQQLILLTNPGEVVRRFTRRPRAFPSSLPAPHLSFHPSPSRNKLNFLCLLYLSPHVALNFTRYDLLHKDCRGDKAARNTGASLLNVQSESATRTYCHGLNT